MQPFVGAFSTYYPSIHGFKFQFFDVENKKITMDQPRLSQTYLIAIPLHTTIYMELPRSP